MIGTILNFLFLTFSLIKCILSPVNTNRSPMTIKSNKDQLTWLEKRFPKRGINNSNRGGNALLITVKFMIKYFFKNKKEVKNDLLSNMAPPIIQSCSTISFFDGLFIS